MTATRAEAPYSPTPDPAERWAYYADVADVIEGRTDLADAPVDVRAGLSWDDQARALAAAAARRAGDRWRADFCARHGLAVDDDAAYRDAVLAIAETAARGEAEAIYDAAAVWGDVDLSADWRAVWESTEDRPPTSLDTGQQNDISGEAASPRDPLGQALAAGIERVQRNDRAKIGLSAAIRAAAVAVQDDDDAGAVILSGLASSVDGCRYVRAYRDVCGAYLARPDSCHVRACPDCERARSARYVRRIAGVAQAMTRPKLVTFTIPNVPPGGLGAGIDVLLEAFAALRHRALLAGGPCRAAHRQSDDRVARCKHPPHRQDRAAAGTCCCARCVIVAGGTTARPRRGCRACIHAPAAGGVYALEVTWNADAGTWHPHVHALIDAPYLLRAELRDAWRAVTCDAIRRAEARGRASRRGTGKRADDAPKGRVALPRCEHRGDDQGRSVDGCRGASHVWITAVGRTAQDRTDAIRETIKYVTKGVLQADGTINPAIGPRPLAELLLSLRGRRLLAGFGTFRGITDDDPDADAEPVLSGPDVPTELRGLPVTCPACRMPAEWAAPLTVARAHCRPLPGGRLAWHPPPIGGRIT